MKFLSFHKLALLFICAALVPFYTVKVSAQQNPVALDSLRVDIWPEYDQPSVLLIYHITLSPQVSLPANLTFRIPAQAGQPHALAMQDVAGLYNLNYELNAAGEWIEVQFTAPVPEIRIEYYDPTITKTGTTREYTFRWPGDYTVENFSISVQQPMKVTAMSFRPSLGSGVQAADGMTYYSLAAGRVPENTPLNLEMTYEKPDDSLTNPQQFQPAQPNQPVNSETSGRVTLDQMLPWALGGVGILLIAAGLIWYWRTGRTPAPAAQSRQRQRHSAASVEKAQAGSPGTTVSPTPENGVFCYQCGKRAVSGDVFCRACGTKLR